MLEITDVFKTLGITEEAKDLDADKFRTIVESHYVPIETAHENPTIVAKAVGRMAGSVTTKAKQLFGLSESDVKDKKLEEILELGVSSYENKIGALKESVKNGSEKKVADLMKTLDEKEKAVTDYKTANERIQKELDDFKTSSDNTLKQYKVNYLLKDIKSRVPIAEGVNEITKKGFDYAIQEKYDFDLENDELIVKDKKGTRIQSKKGKAGGLADALEILELEAAQAGILKMNNVPPKKVVNFVPPVQNGTRVKRDLRTRTI